MVLVEGSSIGSAASGRNGGFMESSLTHGVGNGQERFPDEMPALERLGLDNLNEIESAIGRYGIDCDYERTGVIDIAIDEPMVAELRSDAEHLQALGQDVELLDEAAMQAEVHSPTYRAGLWRRDRAALVDPARLVWGLKAAAESLGVRIYEDTKVIGLENDGVGVLATTPLGRLRAGRVALGTNAFPPLLRRMKHYIAPVYDYALDDGTALSRAARLGRMAAAPGPVRHGQPVPLLPADRGRPHPVGRLRRRLLLRREGHRRSSSSGRSPGPCWPGTSSRPSPSSKACSSATSGVA